MILTRREAFKIFINEYQKLKEGEKTDVSRICNKLLQVNLITKRKASDANDYRFILAYKEVFEAFLALLDFELIIRRDTEVIYIVNESNFNHLRLRKVESVLLLVIRIIYQRKKDNVTLGEDVEIFLYEIHDELTKIGYLDNKRITKNELKPALVMFRNYNLIDYIDTGLHDDCRIKIYPTILYVTDFESIKGVINKLEGYLDGINPEEENEGDEL